MVNKQQFAETSFTQDTFTQVKEGDSVVGEFLYQRTASSSQSCSVRYRILYLYYIPSLLH